MKSVFSTSGFERKWLLYGATGYTGRMIACEAVRQGLRPILAGRNARELDRLASELGLEARVFSCAQADQILPNLSQVDLVLHCAGPFSATSRPMVEACLQAKVHYLDITGEIPVFERILGSSRRFSDAGVVAIPGVGFDVVPSDCLIAMLKERLPDASHLMLALKISASPSQGTAKTLVEGLHAGIVVRRSGRLERLPAGSRLQSVRFWKGERARPVVGISWGDVSSAYFSTKIENIDAYLAASKSVIRMLKLSRWFSPWLAHSGVQSRMKSWVERRVKPPGEREREDAPYFLYGKVSNPKGESHEMRIRTPNGYSLTVDSALKCLKKVRAGEVAPGSWTPSRAFGSGFLRELQGVEFE